MLAKNIWSSKGKVNQAEWLFLLTGGTAAETFEQSPITWISNAVWAQIQKYNLKINEFILIYIFVLEFNFEMI